MQKITFLSSLLFLLALTSASGSITELYVPLSFSLLFHSARQLSRFLFAFLHVPRLRQLAVDVVVGHPFSLLSFSPNGVSLIAFRGWCMLRKRCALGETMFRLWTHSLCFLPAWKGHSFIQYPSKNLFFSLDARRRLLSLLLYDLRCRCCHSALLLSIYFFCTKI